jgi:diguanylate cyclase
MSIETNTLADWQAVMGAVPAPVAQSLARLVADHHVALSAGFYEALMVDPEAAIFLSNESVRARIMPALQRWMTVLFGASGVADPLAVAAMQRQVGDVHARADIPVGLVSRGMRLLKSRIHALLVASPLEREDLVRAVGYVDGLMDLAFAEMSSAYVRAHELGARIDETFRIVTAGQNAALERHKQLGALTDWENSVLRALATGSPLSAVVAMRASAFGLWLQHKAPLLFDESPELAALMQQVQKMDGMLLPLMVNQQQQKRLAALPLDTTGLLRDFFAELEETLFLLNNLFERLADMEVSRDVLTQLYNRRFLPTILRRELDMARKHHNPFCVLMIDVDHFKMVNDEHGHEAGDRVLQHISALLMSHGRASDFYFRYGGEEFLAIINEVTDEQALAVAEKIRSRIAEAEIPLSDEQKLGVTVSIGVAVHQGHPDYRHLINRADEAMYEAKRSGRNRVCAAAA